MNYCLRYKEILTPIDGSQEIHELAFLHEAGHTAIAKQGVVVTGDTGDCLYLNSNHSTQLRALLIRQKNTHPDSSIVVGALKRTQDDLIEHIEAIDSDAVDAFLIAPPIGESDQNKIQEVYLRVADRGKPIVAYSISSVTGFPLDLDFLLQLHDAVPLVNAVNNVESNLRLADEFATHRPNLFYFQGNMKQLEPAYRFLLGAGIDPYTIGQISGVDNYSPFEEMTKGVHYKSKAEKRAAAAQQQALLNEWLSVMDLAEHSSESAVLRWLVNSSWSVYPTEIAEGMARPRAANIVQITQWSSRFTRMLRERGTVPAPGRTKLRGDA